ncbi:MAG: bifunctional metallophosphatase/5'-nucleotidase [Candidatus Riflebacteria bacterium]|nr:bifunctional metallophosphatase/5'-nucleotidase [Candidatus Riflebacteria bacterium]
MVAVLVAAMVWLPPAASGLERPGELTILHTSDYHAHAEPFDHASGTNIGGYARLQSYRDGLVARGRKVLLLSSGDTIQGTLPYRLFKKFPEIEVMNRLGFAAMALGNHEFDGGTEVLAEAFAGCAFPILAANLRLPAGSSLNRLVKPWTMLEADTTGGPVRIALIGLTDEMLIDAVPRGLLEGVTVHDAFTTLRHLLPEVRRAKPDLILVLAHLGWPREVGLADTFPEVAGILGGHTHLFTDPPIVRETPHGHQFLSEPGEYGRALTRYDLRLTPASSGVRVEVAAAALVYMDSRVPEAAGIKEKLAAYRAECDKTNAAVVGAATALLDGDRPQIRSRDTNLGNLVADSFATALGADIGLVNGGGIRGSILPGEITVGDCLDVLPFENYLVKLQMTGESLYRLYEQVEEGMRFFPGYGGFLHVSKGFAARFTRDGPRLSLHGRAIDPTGIYTVSTVDFLANGGNGLEALTRCVASEATRTLAADALVELVKNRKTIGAETETRTRVEIALSGEAGPAPTAAGSGHEAAAGHGMSWSDLLDPGALLADLAAWLGGRALAVGVIGGGSHSMIEAGAIPLPFDRLVPAAPVD